jgi:hypothetical protein
MCKHLFESEELYKNYIAPLLLDLAYDKIVNVRISLSKFIEKIIKKNKFEYLKNDETMRKIVTILRKDTNNEVNSYMKDLNDIKDIDVQLGVYVNDKFIDIMKYVSDEFGITRNVPLESIVRETSNSIKVNKEEVTNNENIISTKNNDINNGNVLVDNPVIPLQNNINNNNDNKHDVKNLEYQTPKSEENKHDDQVVNTSTPEKDDKNVDNQISNEEKNNEQNDNNQTSGSNEKEETKES